MNSTTKTIGAFILKVIKMLKIEMKTAEVKSLKETEKIKEEAYKIMAKYGSSSSEQKI